MRDFSSTEETWRYRSKSNQKEVQSINQNTCASKKLVTVSARRSSVVRWFAVTRRVLIIVWIFCSMIRCAWSLEEWEDFMRDIISLLKIILLSNITHFLLEQRAAQRWALAAAGENKAWKRETAKVTKKAKKRAESQPSAARFVSLHLTRKVVLCLEN